MRLASWTLLLLLLAAGTWAEEVRHFPLVLPPSLEARRVEFEDVLARAERRLAAFAGAHGWEPLVRESFVDRAEVFEDLESLHRTLRELTGSPPTLELPDTFLAGLEQRVLALASPELYRHNYPQGSEPDAYEKLICHEMAHRLHIRILEGDEEAMGPIWFFEGFAVYAAGQFEGSRLSLSSEEIWRVVRAQERGSYQEYGIVLRHFLERASLQELVRRAGSADFTEYLRGL